MINNYSDDHISYQNVMNIISFNNFNKEIINDINEIIKQKDFDKYHINLILSLILKLRGIKDIKF